MRRPLPPLALCAVLATVGPACDGCDDDPAGKVPFKQDSHDGPQAPPDEDEPPFEPTVAEPFPDGTSRVAVEGVPLAVASGSIRALLPLDVDDDGDRDALFIRAEKKGGVTVGFARQNTDAFRVRGLGRLLQPSTEECTVRDAKLRTVSPNYAVLSVARACAEAPERTIAILGTGDEPRLLERITLLPEEGRTPGDVTLAIQTTRVDEDEHEDVVLQVAAKPPDAAEPARVKLPWLNRPGGLARDRAEPEETLAELADQALEQLGDDPEAALAIARRASTLHGVLCREGGAPRLQFGDGGGLTCGRSRAAGRAAAVAAAAHARAGRFFEALAAQEHMERPGLSVTAADRKRVEAAWSRAPVPEGLSWRKVASHRPGAMPDVHLPPVGFTDPDTLLLRGASPQSVDLTTGESRPAPEAAGPGLVRDPSGELAVVDVGRSCEGHVLSIVPASRVVAGVVAGRTLSEPLLEPKAPPADARCPGKLPAALREDDGGWHVLGWAPQGVVAVHGATIRVVPLTVEGRPAAEPTVLAPGTPPPAPLPRGRATPDGQAYVLGSPHGVLLRLLHDGDRTVLLRPEGWAASGEPPEAVAIAPDASRVAVLRDGEVWVIQGLP